MAYKKKLRLCYSDLSHFYPKALRTSQHRSQHLHHSESLTKPFCHPNTCLLSYIGMNILQSKECICKSRRHGIFHLNFWWRINTTVTEKFRLNKRNVPLEWFEMGVDNADNQKNSSTSKTGRYQINLLIRH